MKPIPPYRHHIIPRIRVEDRTYRHAGNETEPLNIYQQMIQASLLGMILIDMQQSDFPVIYANPAFERNTSYTLDEVSGRNTHFLQGEDPLAQAF